MRKRKVPFPVRVNGQNFTPADFEKKINEAIEGCTHMLVSGGKDFSFGVSKTESLSVKEGVKNVINACVKAVSLIFFCQNNQEINKHNAIESVTLQTSKSIPIAIFENHLQEEEQESK